MGVRGVSSFLKANSSILSIYKQLKNVKLIIDGNNFTFWWWTQNYMFCGSDYQRIDENFRIWYLQIIKFAEIVFIFDGAIDIDKLKCKYERLFNQMNEIKTHELCAIEQLLLPSIPPILLQNCIMQAIRELNGDCIIANTEADMHIAQYAIHSGAYGILSNDTDFLFYQFSSRYQLLLIPFWTLGTNDEGIMYGQVFSPSKFIDFCKIKKEILPLLCGLCGNDLCNQKIVNSLQSVIIHYDYYLMDKEKNNTMISSKSYSSIKVKKTLKDKERERRRAKVKSITTSTLNIINDEKDMIKQSNIETVPDSCEIKVIRNKIYPEKNNYEFSSSIVLKAVLKILKHFLQSLGTSTNTLSLHSDQIIEKFLVFLFHANKSTKVFQEAFLEFRGIYLSYMVEQNDDFTSQKSTFSTTEAILLTENHLYWARPVSSYDEFIHFNLRHIKYRLYEFILKRGQVKAVQNGETTQINSYYIDEVSATMESGIWSSRILFPFCTISDTFQSNDSFLSCVLYILFGSSEDINAYHTLLENKLFDTFFIRIITELTLQMPDCTSSYISFLLSFFQLSCIIESSIGLSNRCNNSDRSNLNDNDTVVSDVSVEKSWVELQILLQLVHVVVDIAGGLQFSQDSENRLCNGFPIRKLSYELFVSLFQKAFP